MGILNITPDSFADGGVHFNVDRAVEAGLRMVDAGADILDIGGESTRPGADQVGADEEMRRVLPVIERLRPQIRALISIDTYKASVAKEAVDRGATIINDISGLQYDSNLGAVTAETGAAVVLMHTRGRSRDDVRARGLSGCHSRGWDGTWRRRWIAHVRPASSASPSSSIQDSDLRSGQSTVSNCWRIFGSSPISTGRCWPGHRGSRS